MKTWQWTSIMWILCMNCYYVSDRQLMALISAYVFILIGTFITIVEIGNKEENNE